MLHILYISAKAFCVSWNKF